MWVTPGLSTCTSNGSAPRSNQSRPHRATCRRCAGWATGSSPDGTRWAALTRSPDIPSGTIPPAQGGRARQIVGNKRHAQVAAGRFVAAYGAKVAKAAVHVTGDFYG